MGEHDAKREDEVERVDTDRAGEQEVEIHEEAEESGRAGEETDDEAEPDEQFADRDGIRPRDEVREHRALEERGVPHLDIRVGTSGLAERPLNESFQSSPRATTEPRRIDYLFISGHEPPVAEIETDDEP